MKRAPLTAPISLRRPGQRDAARQLADQILRADARRTRAMLANRGNGGKKPAPAPMVGPRRLTLRDLHLHPLAPRAERKGGNRG